MKTESSNYKQKPPPPSDYRRFEDLDAYKAAREFRKHMFSAPAYGISESDLETLLGNDDSASTLQPFNLSTESQ